MKVFLCSGFLETVGNVFPEIRGINGINGYPRGGNSRMDGAVFLGKVFFVVWLMGRGIARLLGRITIVYTFPREEGVISNGEGILGDMSFQIERGIVA